MYVSYSYCCYMINIPSTAAEISDNMLYSNKETFL